ncbi:hypothetical protein ACFVU2_01755 [Leifsonia sp. NPDC058194]|uniref:hypothetical protein n=1 Tax=Leifsonia sp. NPDC058194 TaxID=3346374 RepID=UPI0036DCD2B7
MPRRATAARRAEVAIGEKAELDGLLHTLRDDATAEYGFARELGSRRRRARAHQVDDAG